MEVSTQVVSGIKWPAGPKSAGDGSWLQVVGSVEIGRIEIWLFVKSVCLFLFDHISGFVLQRPDHQIILAISRVGIIPNWPYFKLVKNINSTSWDENPDVLLFCIGWNHQSDMTQYTSTRIVIARLASICLHRKQTQDVHCMSPARERIEILEREIEREILGVKVWLVVPDVSKRYLFDMFWIYCQGEHYSYCPQQFVSIYIYIHIHTYIAIYCKFNKRNDDQTWW